MPRLRQVSRADASPGVAALYGRLFGERDPVREPGTATGTPGNWWTVFALVPDIFDHAVAGFGLYASDRRRIDPKLREIGMVRVGFAVGSQFVFSQHCKAARGVGIPEEKLRAIPAWQTFDGFSTLERALLAYTDALVLQGGRVADSIFDILRKELTDEEILEFSYVIGTYAMHATLCRALRLEYDDVNERVVEIPAPEASA